MYDFVEGLLSIEPDELDVLFLVNKIKFNAASTFISKFSNLIKNKNRPLKGNEASFKMPMTDFIFEKIIWNRINESEQCISKPKKKRVEIKTFKRLKEILLDVNLLYKKTETLFSFLCPSGIITERGTIILEDAELVVERGRRCLILDGGEDKLLVIFFDHGDDFVNITELFIPLTYELKVKGRVAIIPKTIVKYNPVILIHKTNIKNNLLVAAQFWNVNSDNVIQQPMIAYY